MKLSKGTKLLILGILLVVIDQIIKILVKTNMTIGEHFSVIGNWFHILNHLHTTSFVNTKKARNLLSLFHQRYPHTHHTNNKQQAHANKVYYHPNDVYITMT